MARLVRKVPELVFSGLTTKDPEALHEALAGVARASAALGGALVCAVDPRADVHVDSVLKRVASIAAGLPWRSSMPTILASWTRLSVSTK